MRFVADDDLPVMPKLRAVELVVTEPWLHRHRELPLARVEHAANADANTRFDLGRQLDKTIGGNHVSVAFEMKKRISTRKLTPRYYLERPAKRRLDDDFYESVARAYAGAVAWGLDPRKTLAADSGTPADTVARWISTARKRGFLSSGEPGKASGALTERGSEDG